MTNLGWRSGALQRSTRPRLTPSSVPKFGSVRKRATEVKEELIPLFTDFVETRYNFDTLTHPPEGDRAEAKSSILHQLDELRSLLEKLAEGKTVSPNEPVLRYNNWLTTCDAGGLPLDRPDTMGEYLGCRLRDELSRLGEYLNMPSAAAL